MSCLLTAQCAHCTHWAVSCIGGIRDTAYRNQMCLVSTSRLFTSTVMHIVYKGCISHFCELWLALFISSKLWAEHFFLHVNCDFRYFLWTVIGHIYLMWHVIGHLFTLCELWLWPIFCCKLWLKMITRCIICELWCDFFSV